ncbi:extracellular solute-binding protein [Blautia schinkii]|nr:extracellular solute-binding protein [Blautia schinkii]
MKKVLVGALASVMAISSLSCITVAAAEKPFEGETITVLVDTDFTRIGFDAVCEAAKEKLGLEVEVETRVNGSEGDNVVKTRLVAGEMTDICYYNSGSLLKALNPADYFLDLSDQEFMSKLEDTYLSTVTVDGAAYGIPFESAAVGGIFYNREKYEEYGLSVPKTWDEFLVNCDKLKEAGETAVIGTYADSWTSQIPYLFDNYNLVAEEPDFLDNFEAGTAKWAETEAGIKSFQKIADISKYFNEDYTASTYDDGVDKIAMGDGIHLFMFSSFLPNLYDLYGNEVGDNIGYFAIPGDDPENVGATLNITSSFYANKNSENLDAVLAFMEFYLSDEGLDAFSSVQQPNGPYFVKGYELPDTVFRCIKEDIQPYFDEGKTYPAAEFLVSVKGTDCAAICQELGTGQITAEEAAAAYDRDCYKQAMQLGLGWKEE